MAQTIEELVGKLRLENAQFLQAVKDSTARLDDLDHSVKRVDKTISGMEKSVTSSMKKVLEETSGTSSSFAGMAKSALTAAASFYALSKAVSFTKEVAMIGARYETLSVVMATVGKNAGYSSVQMEANAQALQKLGISMTASREVTVRAVQAHISLADSLKLARIAQNAAVIGNINSSEALARLTHGIQAQQVEVLRNIGINVSLEKSWKKFADRIGTTSEKLNESQKMQAVLNEVMLRGEDIAGTYEAAMKTAGKQITSFSRYIEDFQVEMGLAFGPATTILVADATEAMKHFSEVVKRKDTQESLKNIALGISSIGSVAIAVSEKLATMVGWIGAIVAYKNKLLEDYRIQQGIPVVYRGLIDESALLADQVKRTDAALAEFFGSMEKVGAGTTKTAKSQKELNKELRELDAAIKDSFFGLDKYADKINEIRGGWVNKQFLNTNYELSMNQSDWDGINQNIKDIEEANKDASEKAAKDWERSLEKQQKDQEHYLERVQDATADTFYDIFKNTEEGFSGLFDRVGDFFLKMLAEMAAQAIARPIIIPMIQSVMGSFGGASGAAGGSSSGAGGLLQMAGNTLWNNYGANTGLGQYISGAMATPLWTNSGQVLMQEGISGYTGTSMIGSGATYTLGNALGAYGMGSLGYQYIGGAIGLPQGQYSGIGAGLGAAAGSWAGTALASSAATGLATGAGAGGAAAGATSGAAAGSYWPVVGTIIGAIVGGLGASFLGGDGNRHMTMQNMPELDYGGTMDYNTGAVNYDDYRYRTGTYAGRNKYYGDAFGVLEDATNEIAAGIWASVDETLSMFPDEVAAGIKEDLGALTFKFNEDKTWVIASDRFEGHMEKILGWFAEEIYEGIQPVIQKGFADYAQGLVQDETLSGLFGRLSENNILKTSLTNTALFNADYSMAAGADFDTYIQEVNTWLNAFTQLEGVFSAVDSAVNDILNPLTAFELGIRGIDTQFNQLKSTLYQVGASAKELDTIEDQRDQAIRNYYAKTAGDIDDQLTDQINKMSLSDQDYQIWKATESFTKTMEAIGELGPDFDYLGKKAEEAFKQTVDGINNVIVVVQEFVDLTAGISINQALGFSAAGKPVIAQIQEDIAFRASGMSKTDWLQQKIKGYGEQYNAGDMPLSDWQAAMSTVSAWWAAATAAEMDAANAWSQAADKAKELSKSLQSLRDNLLLGSLSVALPSAKYGEAADIYASKLAGARTGGAAGVEDFTAFASEYLSVAQENFKSSDTYQKLFASVIADIDSLMLMVEAPDYTQRIYEESKTQTDILRSIDQGIITLAMEYTSSIGNIISDKNTAAGINQAAIDKIAYTYGFTPGYGHSLQLEAVMGLTAGSQWVKDVAAAAGVSPEQVLKDRDTLDAYYSQLGYADGGIASGPSTGYMAKLHGTELIIPIGANGGDMEVSSSRSINVTVMVGGEEFFAVIDERADNVRVKAERRGAGAVRLA